ncbi:MAG: DNA-3-methyladenine glycosylase [Candidatus Falkowbacteria bacterium]
MLKKSFFNRPTLKVAQDLLGCFLVKKINNKIIKTKIIETEAYNGPNDLASHASRGKTERNKIMFDEPGLIYIYLIYGMHHMLNIVTEKKDYPAAVLIRGLENNLTNGPAKLTKYLNIDKSFNGLPIYTKKYGLWIEDRKENLKSNQIIKTTRVGIDYAKEYRDKKWRFILNKKNKG